MNETSPNPAQARLVVLALIAVQIFFGVHYLAAKEVLTEIPPRAWALLRVGGAFLLLLAVSLASGRRLPTDRGVIGRLALFAIFGVGINQICFVEGLSRTTPTHSSLINTTIPVDTLLIAVLLGREQLRWRKILAVLAALPGVLLIIRPGLDAVPSSVQAGDLLTMVNAASFSLFLVISKRVLARVDALAATTLLLFFGTVFISLFGLPQLLAFDLGSVSTRGWLLAAFIVLLPTAGAYLLNFWALARVESSVVAFFIFLQPLLAAGLSVLLHGERPATAVWFGGALIFLGVGLALWRPRSRRTPAGA